MLIPHSSILTSLTYTYDLIESFVYARHLVTIHNKRNDIISIPLLLEDNELYCLQLYLTQSDDYTLYNNERTMISIDLLSYYPNFPWIYVVSRFFICVIKLYVYSLLHLLKLNRYTARSTILSYDFMSYQIHNCLINSVIVHRIKPV